MGPTDPATAIIPINLGTAAAFDQDVFPLAYYELGGNLSKGSFLIESTLEEMEKIKELGIDLNKNEEFIFNTRVELEDLRAQRTELYRKTLNPFKAFRNYRAARLFHAASRAVYLDTKQTSEKIHREEGRVQVVSSAQMQMVNDAVSPDAVIVGIVVGLPNGLNDKAQQTINDATKAIATTDPFRNDSAISQLRDDEQEITLADTASLLSQDEYGSGVDEGNRTSVASSDLQQSRPTSPQTINHIHIIQNSIVTTSSNLNGFTVNRGSGNSGASVTQGVAP